MKKITCKALLLALFISIAVPAFTGASNRENTSSPALESFQTSGIIRGIARDKVTGETLIGATVVIKETRQGTTSGFDGTFVLRNIPFGDYTLVANYISYEPIENTISLSAQNREFEILLGFVSVALQLNEVSVFARRERQTELSARASEKNSLTVMNVVSARAIELSPDLDIANVVQRVSGVTLEKNSSGDAQYAILRGMDKRYNYTLVNGVKIPSPHNQQRYVPLNLFPSELADRVEVTKTLTPDMEGDASGGVINIEMKDAPSAFTFNANAALGYNSFFIDHNYHYYSPSSIIMASPRELQGSSYRATESDFGTKWGALQNRQPLPNGVAGLTFGSRFLNNRLGFIAAANYQNLFKGSYSTIYDDSHAQDNRVVIGKMREREYFENQFQLGTHLKTDFRLSAKHSLELYNAFIKMDNYSVRETTTTNFGLNYDPENNRFDLNFQTRLRTNKQSILVSHLQGDHQLLPKLSLNWSGVYSIASHREPDKSYFNLDRIVIGELDNIYPDADGSTREWAFNNDRDLGGYLNLSYKTRLLNSNLTFKTGGLFRDKKRDNSLVEYRFKPNGQYIKGQNFETIDQIGWTLQTPFGSVGPLEYDAHEKIGAGYLMAHLNNTMGDITAGIRAEYTDQGYFMYFPGPGNAANGGQKYLDLLPSVKLKYTPNVNTNIRASWFRSINRPGFFEVVPYLIIAEDYMEFGNKDLKRARIDNIDLRWEKFPSPTEQFMVGVFYKYLNNPIEMSYTTVNRRQYGYGPQNLGNARNLGIEADVIKYFRSFGVKANYTYTYSAISTPKAYYGPDERGNSTLLFKEQTRPLSGQSPHVANLSLLYKNTRFGWDAQIAAAYTHDKIIIASRFLDADYWQARSVQFDASFEKRFRGGFSLFGKVNNIMNSPLFNYIKKVYPDNVGYPGQDQFSDRTLLRHDIYTRSILIGIRYKHQ